MDLIESLKDVKIKNIDEKLNLFFSISEKMSKLMFSIQGQLEELQKEVDILKNFNQSKQKRNGLSSAPLPPPHSPLSRPKAENASPVNVKGEIMKELKILFKKRDEKDGKRI